jgi:hypothetical protein
MRLTSGGRVAKVTCGNGSRMSGSWPEYKKTPSPGLAPTKLADTAAGVWSNKCILPPWRPLNEPALSVTNPIT